MQVEEFLECTAERTPDKIALVCQGRRLSYREVEEQSSRLAQALIAAGIERGDRVAIFMDHSVEAVLSLFAVLKAGAAYLMVNPTTKGEKLAGILNDCQASGLLSDANKLDRVQECRQKTPSLRTVFLGGHAPRTDGGTDYLSLEGAIGETRPLNRRKGIDVDLAALSYTSGSTGKPKGVMLTHLNIVSAVNSITAYLENTADDVILNVLPLSFGYGLFQTFLAFKVGGTLVLERSFTFPHAVLETLQKETATAFPLVPTIAAILLQLDLQKYDFSSLRYITNAAAALPLEHIRKLRKLLPQVKIYSMYGLTECTRVTYLPPDQIDVRPTSVGRGMPNQELYLVDEHGHRVGPGVVGELVIRGSHVMKGYWGAPEETEKKLKPAPLPGEKVLHSGDLFKMDAQGYLYFASRKDDIIKTGGEKVSPREIEEVLYALDEIAEAAVIGVPDPILGQVVKAVLRLREGAQLTAQHVLRHCANHLEDFMVPKYVEFRDSLPKTTSGKICKHELRVPAAEQP